MLVAKRVRGSNGQDPQGSADETEDEDLEGTESEDDGEEEGDESAESGESGGQGATGSDLDGMSADQLKAEAIRLRNENARRRKTASDLRKKQVAEEAARKGKPSPDELESENGKLRRQVVELTVSTELQAYIAEKHPSYLKLSKRIAKFVDLDDVDLSDSDSIRDAVASAVDEFVSEVPISSKNGSADDEPVTDANGRPVGSPGATPARKPAGDQTSRQRREKLFPSIYGQTPKA